MAPNLIKIDEVVPAILHINMDEMQKKVLGDPNLKKKMEDLVDELKKEYNRLGEIK